MILVYSPNVILLYYQVCEKKKATTTISAFRFVISNTNCIKLLRFLYLAQMSDSLEHGAPLELVEGLGMARCSLCKAQLLITIGIIVEAIIFDKLRPLGLH
jgi:hypothetical protein